MVRPKQLEISLEPHKAEILRKCNRGFTLEMLALWLQTKDITVSATSLSKYLKEWGVAKRVNKDENFQAIIKQGVENNTRDSEMIQTLKDSGYDISVRSLRRERARQGCFRRYTKERFTEVQQDFEDFVRTELREGRMQNLGIRATKAYCAKRGYIFSRGLIQQVLQKLDPEGLAERTPARLSRAKTNIDPALQSQ